MEDKRILTCVYCGMAYPAGTEPHSDQVLTDHIEICEKHPLRAALDKIVMLESTIKEMKPEDEKDVGLRFRGIPVDEVKEESHWEAFVEWARSKEISMERKAHWGPWWECYKAGFDKCHEIVCDAYGHHLQI